MLNSKFCSNKKQTSSILAKWIVVSSLKKWNKKEKNNNVRQYRNIMALMLIENKTSFLSQGCILKVAL